MAGAPTGTVTFLFTDIEGSTKLAREHAETWESARAKHHAILHAAIKSNHGFVFQIIGDAFCAAFHTAGDALKAAIRSQQDLQSEPWGEAAIRVRMGIHTGEAEIDGKDYRGYLTMSLVQRLMSAGHGGQILISGATENLLRGPLPRDVNLRDLGKHSFKDVPQPVRVFQVMASGLQIDFPALRALDVFPNNLPTQLKSFVGREKEIHAVCEVLRRPSVRMVTITGTGGIGKTSLSIQIGLNLLQDFDDGVFFVDLSSLRQAELVVPTIARTFKLHELPEKPLSELLYEHLANKKLLLILDNFEQVLEAAPHLNSLLSAAKQLKILVTSRALLRLSAEHDFPLGPLPLPEGSHVDALSDNEAIQLFVERLQAVRPDFQLSKEYIAIIAQICRQLDGLPLAIELAAARGRLFTPQQLLSQLKNHLRLLTGGARDLPERHQTMRSAIEWGYELLTAEEKQLFNRLAVFVGGSTLDAVHNVCGDGDIDVLGGIESLLDKHMINRKETGPEPRFWMFETLREFAVEKLEASEEVTSLRCQHAVYYANQNSKAEDDLDNVRSALHWCLKRQVTEPALRLASDFYFWEKRVTEGLQLITRVLALPAAQTATQERGLVLYSAAALSYFNRDYPAARAFLDELLRVGHELHDPSLIWDQKFATAGVTMAEGDYQSAYDIYLGARGDGDSFGFALCTLGMASCTLMLHDLEAASQHAEEARKIFDELGMKNYLVDSDTILGYIALEQGNLAMAWTYFRRAIRTAASNSVEQRLGVIFAGLGGAALRQENLYKAARWFGIAEMMISTTGYYARYLPEAISQGYLAQVKSLLEPHDFQAAWEEGRTMTVEQAIDLALSDKQ